MLWVQFLPPLRGIPVLPLVCQLAIFDGLVAGLSRQPRGAHKEAHSVEHSLWEQDVAGSNPVLPFGGQPLHISPVGAVPQAIEVRFPVRNRVNTQVAQ